MRIDCGYFLNCNINKKVQQRSHSTPYRYGYTFEWLLWYSYCITQQKITFLGYPSSQKQMEISPGPPSRNVFSFALFIWRSLSGKVLEVEYQLSEFLLPNCSHDVLSQFFFLSSAANSFNHSQLMFVTQKQHIHTVKNGVTLTLDRYLFLCIFHNILSKVPENMTLQPPFFFVDSD